MQPSQRVVAATAKAISSRVLASSVPVAPCAWFNARNAVSSWGLCLPSASPALRLLASVSVQFCSMKKSPGSRMVGLYKRGPTARSVSAGRG
ncbi:hypothetical protein G6F59_017635 [Rhizopus arrhizus]|nr:hypothetical protein G6F59_017635 [Rhizopus arrhizus]